MLWCAITGTHPEIKLEIPDNRKDDSLLLPTCLPYDYSFSLVYILIFLNGDNTLMVAKNCAKYVINEKCEICQEQYFWEYLKQKITENPDYNTTEILRSCNKSNIIRDMLVGDDVSYSDIIEYVACECDNNIRYFLRSSDGRKIMIENVLSKPPKEILSTLKNDKTELIINSLESLEYDINKLKNILNEIKDLEINKTNNLKTLNINYLDHIDVNYDIDENNLDFCAALDIINHQNCAQQ